MKKRVEEMILNKRESWEEGRIEQLKKLKSKI